MEIASSLRSQRVEKQPFLGPTRGGPFTLVRDAINEAIPDILSLENLDLDPEEVDFDVRFARRGEADRDFRSTAIRPSREPSKLRA